MKIEEKVIQAGTHEIRAIIDQDNNAWFSLTDLIKALKISERKASRKNFSVMEIKKKKYTGRMQRFVTISGLIALTPKGASGYNYRKWIVRMISEYLSHGPFDPGEEIKVKIYSLTPMPIPGSVTK